MAAAKLQRHTGRKRAGRFLAEGPNLVEFALRRGFVSEVFATAEAHERFAPLLRDVPVVEVTDRAAKALSDTVTPTGLVAVCEMPQQSLSAVLVSSPKLIAMPVGISEPGNAGTLIRTADALGAEAVVLAGNSVDVYNSKCLRASAGSVFTIPVVSEPDTATVIATLRAAGLQVLATTLDDAADLGAADLARPTAWLFGSEAHGLPDDIAVLADQRVRIEMPGNAESLNIAAAAAICLYQSARALSDVS